MAHDLTVWKDTVEKSPLSRLLTTILRRNLQQKDYQLACNYYQKTAELDLIAETLLQPRECDTCWAGATRSESLKRFLHYASAIIRCERVQNEAPSVPK